MKKLGLLLIVTNLAACAPDKEIVKVIKGEKGDPGVSCLAEEVENGLSLSCANGVFFVANGKDGLDGADGQDGADGIDGQDGADGQDGVNGQDGEDGEDGSPGEPGPMFGSLSEVELDGCTLIVDGLYGKLQGNGSLKLYNNNSCQGNGVGSLSSTDEIHVLSNGDLLIFQSLAQVLFMLEFN